MRRLHSRHRRRRTTAGLSWADLSSSVEVQREHSVAPAVELPILLPSLTHLGHCLTTFKDLLMSQIREKCLTASVLLVFLGNLFLARFMSDKPSNIKQHPTPQWCPGYRSAKREPKRCNPHPSPCPTGLVARLAPAAYSTDRLQLKGHRLFRRRSVHWVNQDPEEAMGTVVRERERASHWPLLKLALDMF